MKDDLRASRPFTLTDLDHVARAEILFMENPRIKTSDGKQRCSPAVRKHSSLELYRLPCESMLNHPPYSSDLAPVDYSLFPNL
ncbi:hypothetical protein J6590_015676 [Homalodisca vitripennis]|nr:hypothetical protein J6590_015676 [Homalodisca vitripennis]